MESFWNNITKAVYPWAIEILYIFCVCKDNQRQSPQIFTGVL